MAARVLAARRCSKRLYAFPQIRDMAMAGRNDNAAADESATGSWFQRIKGLFIRDKPEEESVQKSGLSAESAPPPKPAGGFASKIVNTVKSAVAPTVYTMELFADELKKAREAGTKVKGASEERVSIILERQERMLRAMAVYKTDQIGAGQMAQVAAKCGTKVEEVEDILSKYLWTKEAYNKVEKLKKEGKPLPKSFDEVEALMGGRWKSPKSVPIVSRNQLCSCGSGKKYKRCCGQGASI